MGILENRRRLAERVRMIADYRTASVGRVVGGVVLVALVAVTQRPGGAGGGGEGRAEIAGGGGDGERAERDGRAGAGAS